MIVPVARLHQFVAAVGDIVVMAVIVVFRGRSRRVVAVVAVIQYSSISS